jgi:hypothetical protein
LVEGYSKGLSSTVLAKRLGVGRSTVLNVLRSLGVVVRRPSEWEEKRIGLGESDNQAFVEILDGLMLGDGSISQQNVLSVEQSCVRVGWLNDLQQYLATLGIKSTLDEIVRPERYRKDGRRLPSYKGFRLRSPAYVELRTQRDRWYPSGLKTVPPDVRVTPRSVAAWVSGDGTGSSAGTLLLCTDGFPVRDVELLINRLRSAFGVRPKLMGSVVRPKIGVLRKDEVVMLRDILIPYLSRCCHYKFRYARPAQKRGSLSPDAVRDIRSKYDSGVRLVEMAQVYGLSRSAINNVGLRRSYPLV